MISFIQLCEMLTNNRTKAWFYFPSELTDFLTEEEKALVVICWSGEPDSYNRIFYPASRFHEMKQKAAQYELEKAKRELAEIENEIFPDDLPTMKELCDKRIAAASMDRHAEVREIDSLIRLRARKDALKG